MSKADLLGAGSSFQQARPVSARRTAIDQATNAPTVGVAPPTALPPSAISLNPENPRSKLGNLTELSGSLRDHGQKTAISVMTRFAYLKANPGREPDLEPDTQYVAIDGNSRLAAAREAGLAAVKVMVDDNLGSDPDSLLESALVANVHRKDLEPLDEAAALAQLLKIHGSQDKLAERLNKSQGWVSQRLALLKLTPELKERLQAGEEQAKHLRAIGNTKPEDQEAALAKIKEKEEARKEAEKAARRTLREQKATVAPQRQEPDLTEASETGSHYPVMKPAELPDPSVDDSAPSQPLSVPAVDVPPAPAAPLSSTRIQPSFLANGNAQPAPAQGARATGPVVPWHDGAAVADIVMRRMPVGQRLVLLAHLQAAAESAPAS
ncbi:ParB/RepB/Spo0J family partition protein [Streptomyces gardneri]|uniref:ParB/RepB/Spo0J family partition protein n=1 Tax=Streptomyces gardneri TaxID=66892 RepID=UPI0035D75AA9